MDCQRGTQCILLEEVMNRVRFGGAIAGVVVLIITPILCSWIMLTGATAQTANSGVSQKWLVDMPRDPDGTTVEQRNIARRLYEDNQPGATKEFYVFSPVTGKALMHSSVNGKVTSSGKRLSPLTVAALGDSVQDEYEGIAIEVNGEKHYTSELIQDDGTYGSSTPYIYWWDTNGNYHQHFFTDGQIIVVTSQPLRLRDTELMLDLNTEEE